MPIRPPILDDRSFEEIVDELLRRIPAHTPEWTHPRVGDPGRSMIDLFAWLADSLMYRVNLIPERQRLVFLQLLGMPLRAAQPAAGLVSVLIDDKQFSGSVVLRPGARIKGGAVFETRHELTVLPVSADAYVKGRLSVKQATDMAPLISELIGLYGLSGMPLAYQTRAAFVADQQRVEGIDLGSETVDGDLWIALLRGEAADPAAVRTTLGGTADGRRQVLSVAVVPTQAPTEPLEELGPRPSIPHQWELSTDRELDGEPEYVALDVLGDTTEGLTRAGVVRLALPSEEHFGAPSDDARQALHAGVGNRPPRLDDPEVADRVISWLRLRTTDPDVQLRLSWVGVNAAEIDQLETMGGVVIGQSDGTADQSFQLPRGSVQAESLILEVEDSAAGYRLWQLTDHLFAEGPEARAFELDAEAGAVRFGDGMRGRVPDPGARVRVAQLRSGGGTAGNLPPAQLTEITARDLGRAPIVAPKLRVLQAVPTQRGVDAETLVEAERRIPAWLRHRNRAVTEQDYQELALGTPGSRIARAEVLPGFLPNQRRADVPGIVSVMVLPAKSETQPPNPRADRPLLGAVHSYLDLRRPVGTELYVIGTEYVPLSVSVAVQVRDGFGAEQTLHAVREAIRAFLWPLPPGGPQHTGWLLGRNVQDREIEVIVAQVSGVRTVAGVNLFSRRSNGTWVQTRGPSPTAPVEFALRDWQLPELLGVTVVQGTQVPPNIAGGGPGGEPGGGQMIPVPVIPEVC